jgi:hypothetical protein
MGTSGRWFRFNGHRSKWHSVCHRASLMDHAVWVPAFAGTTTTIRDFRHAPYVIDGAEYLTSQERQDFENTPPD